MDAEPSREELARRRLKLRLLLAPLLATFAVRSIGVAFAPALLERFPAVLLLMAPLTRHAVLVSPALDTATFLVVGLVALFLADPFAYLLGREYGGDAVDWIARRSGRAQGYVRWVERLFRRAAPLVLFVSPGPFVNLLAGVCRMRIGTWLAFNLAGTLVFLVLLRMFGEALEGPIGIVRDFIAANVVGLTVGSVVVVVVGTLVRRHRMRRLEREVQRSDSVAGGSS